MLASVRDQWSADTRRGGLGGSLLALLVLVIGGAAPAGVVLALRDDQRDNAEQVMDQRTAVASSRAR